MAQSVGRGTLDLGLVSELRWDGAPFLALWST